jgi:UDP:flavonoid glycosyltransferase YjiC (YdhE family)
VPQLDVLHHAAIFVTHGGMNSTLEGLASGVPPIVIPQHLEQLSIGFEVAAGGAGLVLREHVAGKRVTAAQPRRSVERVLTEPSFREAASASRMSLRKSGGYRQAADEIQAYIPRTQRARAGSA